MVLTLGVVFEKSLLKVMFCSITQYFPHHLVVLQFLQARSLFEMILLSIFYMVPEQMKIPGGDMK